VVVVILGIAAAIVIPMISDTSGLQASSAARQIASTLLFAQTAAITDQEQYQVVFDSDNNCYELQDHDGSVISDPMTFGGAYHVDISGPSMQSAKIETANFDGSNIVWFDQLGIPYSGSISETAVPLNSGSVIVRAKDETITVSVEPMTGRISID